ncbi:MAG: S-methyl-5-thioribose-1-phosphate isomerase [Candidatus Altiarchaeota archaeon]
MSNIFHDIKSLRIQGATNIALASLKYLKKFSDKKGFGKKFDIETEKLLRLRPTAVVLYNVINELKKEKSNEKISQLIQELENAKERIAKNGAPLIKNGFQVHTHCHSTHALAVIKEAALQGKRFSVIVDITEPRLQGVKTAKELAKMENIKVILIADNAAGLALSPPFFPIDDLVIVGADAIRKEGVVNKIGTYLLAVAAKEQKIPFYVATTTFAIDKRRKFKIEERPASEIYKKIPGVEIRNPAFDITPLKYITGFITEKGIFSSEEFRRDFIY